MRAFFGFPIIVILLFSCDENRVFEKNTDLHARHWLANEKPEFEFEIKDSAQTYNLYCNIRNSLDYPFARIFISFYLRDSSGTTMEKKLVRQLLFDDKTGEPQGDSGLGDIYDHRIPLKTNYQFPHAGKYTIAFEQFMRTDTLSGILAVGLRVETTGAAN